MMRHKTILLIVAAVAGLCLATGCRDSVRTQDGSSDSIEAARFYDTEAAAKAKTTQRPHGLEIPAPLKGRPEQLLRRTGYVTSYNRETRCPNWTAWHLTAAHTSGSSGRNGMEFTEDTEVPTPRATNNDYYNSRYDRGHMCPSGDNKWDAKAQRQSFLFTNMCPQNHAMNAGDWNDLEIQCRDWARQYGSVYIVTGPIFYDGVQKTVGRNKVAVPDAFFKVVLCTQGKEKAIGFVCPNKGGHKRLSEYAVTVDEVERLTGFDFFPQLADEVERRVEATPASESVALWGLTDSDSRRENYRYSRLQNQNQERNRYRNRQR